MNAGNFYVRYAKEKIPVGNYWDFLLLYTKKLNRY